MYEISSHKHVDKNGKEYEIDVFTEDETVIFSSTPPLSLDVDALGLKIKRKHNGAYRLAFLIKNGALYMTRLDVFSKTAPEIFGVKPSKLYDSDILTYEFNNLPTDYSGTLTIGRHFYMKYWPKDDRVTPVPFASEFYKETGEIKIKDGIITEYNLEPNFEISK